MSINECTDTDCMKGTHLKGAPGCVDESDASRVDRLEKVFAELLTSGEQEALTKIAETWNAICRDVIARGPTRDADCREVAFHIHALQALVMSQAAARAYPGKFRLLGRSATSCWTTGLRGPLGTPR